jgi:sulfur carrier protein ThiS
MLITLKLYASLSDYLPAGGKDNRVDLDIAEDDTVAGVIRRSQLPEHLVHLVLVNGVYVAPEERTVRHLSPGDHLAVWPPIAGG